MNKIKDYFINLKFRKKIILTYLIVSIIPITILGVFCYQQTNRILIEQEKKNLQESFFQAINDTEQTINIYNNIANYTTFNPTLLEVINYKYNSYYEMYDKFHNILDPYINMMKSLHYDIKQFTIYTDNNIVKHSNYIVPLKNIINENWYKKVKNNYQLYWFLDENKSLCSAVQFVNQGNKNINILYLKLNSNNFFEPFYDILRRNCNVCIVNDNNDLIFEDNFYQDQTKLKVPYKEIIQNNQGTFNYNNVDYTLIKAEVPGTQWRAYLYKPIYLIVKSTKNIIYTVLYVVIICLGLIFIVGYGISYIMVNKIERLTDNMKNMNLNNFKVTVTSDSKDEIGILIRSFNKLIKKIQILIKEVYQSQISKKRYEMKALQAQINPHFLYNSLSLINWKALKAGEDEISKMAQLLSTFYRTSLNKGSNTITVENELRNTKSYIDIQLMLHNNSFEVVYNIADDIGKYYMINLLIQPLVENAICHGIDQKRNIKGKLTLTVNKINNVLQIQVKDNGIGMEKGLCEEILTTKSKGYGVNNVNERIKLIYGDEYGLQYNSKIKEGTLVTMLIPIIKDKSELQQ